MVRSLNGEHCAAIRDGGKWAFAPARALAFDPRDIGTAMATALRYHSAALRVASGAASDMAMPGANAPPASAV